MATIRPRDALMGFCLSRDEGCRLKIDQASIDFISRAEAESDAASSSMDDRGRQLELACRVARDIEDGRRKSGLPPSTPAPWPESTWRFLKEQVQHAGH